MDLPGSLAGADAAGDHQRGHRAWALILLQQAGGGYTVLGWTVFGLGLAAGLALVWVHRLPRVLANLVLGVALAAGIAGPYAYSINTATTAHTGSIVTAGPVSSSRGGGGGRGGGQPPSRGQGTSTGQAPGQSQDGRAQGRPGRARAAEREQLAAPTAC